MSRFIRYFIYLSLFIFSFVLPQSSLKADSLLEAGHIVRLQETLESHIQHIHQITSTNTKIAVLTRSQKEALWSEWKNWLFLYTEIDSFRQAYFRLYENQKAPSSSLYLELSYALFLLQNYEAIRFISVMEKCEDGDALLNQAIPELGIENGYYKHFKWTYLNIKKTTEFAMLSTLYSTHKPHPETDLTVVVQTLNKKVLEASITATELTLKNGVNLSLSSTEEILLPAKKTFLASSARTKVWRQNKFWITDNQIKTLKQKLEPGDIILVRKEWQLSNLGIPGYWTHVALYVGDSENAHCVIEAQEPGVIYSTLEKACKADSLLVLRPNISKEEKMEAISNARNYIGRPYDYNFDFATDDVLVCSEVVYKAYENTLSKHFPLTDIAGHKVLPPNDIAKIFSESYQANLPVFSFVAFFDGDESRGKAVLKDVTEAANAYLRPKYYVFQN